MCRSRRELFQSSLFSQSSFQTDPNSRLFNRVRRHDPLQDDPRAGGLRAEGQHRAARAAGPLRRRDADLRRRAALRVRGERWAAAAEAVLWAVSPG